MRLESRKLLFDVTEAAALIARFTTGETLESYLENPMLRAAVEREFEIIGESLSPLSKLEPDLLARIDDAKRAIAFRNVLIHGYAAIADDVVWEVAVSGIGPLRAQVAALSAEP